MYNGVYSNTNVKDKQVDYNERITGMQKKYLMPIKEIAEEIGINYRTIKRAMAGESLYPKSRYKIENYFENMDINTMRTAKRKEKNNG